MELYYVVLTDMNGDSRDAFVRAESPGDAYMLWWENQKEDLDDPLGGFEADPEHYVPERIFRVDDHDPDVRGVLRWEGSNGIRRVWAREDGLEALRPVTPGPSV